MAERVENKPGVRNVIGFFVMPVISHLIVTSTRECKFTDAFSHELCQRKRFNEKEYTLHEGCVGVTEDHGIYNDSI